MTSLAYICTMEKALVEIIFGRKSFIFKISVAFFRLLRCKRRIRSHFAGDDSGKGDMQKGSLQRMVLGE